MQIRAKPNHLLLENKHMDLKIPRVTVGIPVYNGENYLEQAILSVLRQTFDDFELIISDNASTDQTEAISRTYQAQDARVRYVRNACNIGAAKNYNQLVDLARGDYFKWAAHDDICAPELLERCVEVLDADDSIVLCYTLTQIIDEQNSFLYRYPAKPCFTWPSTYRRFLEGVCNHHDQTPVFGLIRTNILRNTVRIGGYSQSDKVLLGELTLIGRSFEIPEPLYLKRIHAEQGWRKHTSQQERQYWWDPSKSEDRIFPTWRLLLEHLKSIEKAPLSSSERLMCFLCMGWWIRRRWRLLLKDLVTDQI